MIEDLEKDVKKAQNNQQWAITFVKDNKDQDRLLKQICAQNKELKLEVLNLSTIANEIHKKERQV